MTNNYSNFSEVFSHFENNRIQVGSEYKHQDILSLAAFKLANNEITSWDGYKPTPLHNFSDMAKDTGVELIVYKDENPRFTLKSFKELRGGQINGDVECAGQLRARAGDEAQDVP